MALTPFDPGSQQLKRIQPMNPFTGSQSSYAAAPSPGISPVVGMKSKTPVRRRLRAKTQGVPGYQRRKGSRPTGPVGPPSMPRTPEAAPLPASPLSPSSSPLGVDWASSRSFGNGGYA